MRLTTVRWPALLPLILIASLFGCDDPLRIDPVAGEPGGNGAPLEPLTVEIVGPRLVRAKGTYAWEAVPSGSTPADTFQWALAYPTSGVHHTLGAARTQSRTVYANDDRFVLTVTLRSMGGRSATATFTVNECIDGCTQP